MLMPKRTKYRRPHRVPHDKGFAKSPGVVHFGEYGLMAVESGWITNRQIEAARIAMTRYMKRQGQVWINIFPHLAKTAKPLEVRMGSGKGSPEGWVAVVKRQRVMFEVGGVTEDVAREALRLAMHKLPIKCKFVRKQEGGADA
jgi:large subunit ribosomal protein L16